VACDVGEIRCKGSIFGLQLNQKKCEFISKSAMPSNSIFFNFIHLNVEEADLLGAPLTVGKAMDTALSRRCDDLARAATRLCFIAAHTHESCLKRRSAHPSLCTRCEPLHAVDMQLYRNSTTCSENASAKPTSPMSNGCKAVRNGGLGVRRVSSFAPSAFLASAAAHVTFRT